MPTTANLATVQGDTFEQPFKLLRQIDDAPFNLSGWTVKSQFKSVFPDETVFDFGTQITAASLGEFRIFRSAANMATVPTGDYVYDVEISAGAEVHTVFQGRFRVGPQVTT